MKMSKIREMYLFSRRVRLIELVSLLEKLGVVEPKHRLIHLHTNTYGCAVEDAENRYWRTRGPT